MSKDFDSQTKDRKIYDFIQIVMAKPFCIMYWTEVGIRLYHELSKKIACVWMQQVLWYENVMGLMFVKPSLAIYWKYGS